MFYHWGRCGLHICSSCVLSPWYASIFLWSFFVMFLSTGIVTSITSMVFCSLSTWLVGIRSHRTLALLFSTTFWVSPIGTWEPLVHMRNRCSFTILAAWLCLSVYHLPACVLHPAAMCWIISRACLVDSLVDTSVHEFPCFTSMGAISSCGLLVIPACYLMTSRTYLGLLSTTQLTSQHLSYLLEIFGSD